MKQNTLDPDLSYSKLLALWNLSNPSICMKFTGKDRLHHTCSKIPVSAKQQNAEEKLTRQVILCSLNHSSLLMNIY